MCQIYSKLTIKTPEQHLIFMAVFQKDKSNPDGIIWVQITAAFGALHLDPPGASLGPQLHWDGLWMLAEGWPAYIFSQSL